MMTVAHLLLAATYFEATPDDPEKLLKLLHAKAPPGRSRPALTASIAFITEIHKAYAAL